MTYVPPRYCYWTQTAEDRTPVLHFTHDPSNTTGYHYKPKDAMRTNVSYELHQHGVPLPNPDKPHSDDFDLHVRITDADETQKSRLREIIELVGRMIKPRITDHGPYPVWMQYTPLTPSEAELTQLHTSLFEQCEIRSRLVEKNGSLGRDLQIERERRLAVGVEAEKLRLANVELSMKVAQLTTELHYLHKAMFGGGAPR